MLARGGSGVLPVLQDCEVSLRGRVLTNEGVQ